MKQIRIKIEGIAHAGFLMDDGTVVRGDTGAVCPASERGKKWDIQKVYDKWVDLDDEILGDDYTSDTEAIPVRVCGCRNCSAYEEQNSRRGACERHGGFVDGDNVDDCIHCTGGYLIYCKEDGCEIPVTTIPVYVENGLTPRDVIRYYLEYPITPMTQEGTVYIQKEIKKWISTSVGAEESWEEKELVFKEDR